LPGLPADTQSTDIILQIKTDTDAGADNLPPAATLTPIFADQRRIKRF
jgi:hypothetical protein